jgi:hypothetical protein
MWQMEYVEFIQRVCAHTESIYICIDPRNISFFPSAAGAGVWESSISIEPKDQLFLSTCNPTPLYICRTCTILHYFLRNQIEYVAVGITSGGTILGYWTIACSSLLLPGTIERSQSSLVALLPFLMNG